MMVIKDIYSQYRYAYPVESRETETIIKAVSHFLKSTDTVGIAYSDNAPEFAKAFEELKIDHQTSIEYLASTKSVVEREARTLIEGTRVNLNQSGMPLSMWPYAVRHHAMALNTTPQLSGDPASWSIRNGGVFLGEQAPFGCLVWFWGNPKKPNPSRAKLAPTSLEGVFLGYNIQVGHVWRGEYLVAKLEGLDENIKEGNVTVLRVKRIAFPEGDFVFPMTADVPVADSDLDFRMQLEDKEDEDKDIQPSSDEDDPPDEPPSHGISEGDLQKMIDERNERDQSPSLEVRPSEVPIRAEDVAKPSSSDYRKDPLFDVFIDYDLDPNVMPNGKPTPKGYVWDALRLVRKKANSKRVPGYPSDLWMRLSPETRAVEWEKYQNRLEEKDKDKDKATPAIVNECFSAPAMPVVQDVYEPHRSSMRELVEEKVEQLQDNLNF